MPDEDAARAAALRLMVPRIADLSVLWLYAGTEPALVRVAHMRTDLGPVSPGPHPTVAERLPRNHPVSRVLRTGQPECENVVSPARLLEVTRDATHVAQLRALAPTTAMILPLSVRGHVLGALVLGTTFQSRRLYRSCDLSFASELAQRIAAALDRGRRYDRLRAAVREHTAHLAATSHDLMDPLSTIEVALAFVRDHGSAALAAAAASGSNANVAAVLELLGAARRASRRMRRVVRTNLDVGRRSVGVLAFTPRCVLPAPLLIDLVEQYRVLARTRGVTLTLETRGTLPPAHMGAEGLERAIGNLLGNAIKFTLPGGRVTIGAAATEHWLTITVMDTGPGISVEDQSRIFEPHWQGHHAAHLGSGLGLAISRALIATAGGRLTCASSPGQGATFSIELPIVDQQLTPARSDEGVA
jgi:signal transduction histidine kinase